jgi:DNA replication and repair protein RecF
LGKNGSGKTNILESISMLSAGKGLRNAKNNEIITNFDTNLSTWGVNINYSNAELSYKLIFGNKFNPLSLKWSGFSKINDDNTKKKSAISNFLRIIWLTPQMENLFLAPPSVRRKFLDRMTFNFFPNHAKQILEHEYFLQSRNKILSDIDWNIRWLEQIEVKITELSIKIIENRLACLQIINESLETLDINYLKPLFFMQGEIEERMKIDDEVQTSEFISARLKQGRVYDARLRRCGIGSHKSELIIVDREKNRTGNLCSTGEQKSMIIALLIGQSYAIYKHSKIAPILLLDEIFAHLDSGRKAELILELQKTPSQIWISSTDMNLYKLISDCKKFICN